MTYEDRTVTGSNPLAWIAITLPEPLLIRRVKAFTFKVSLKIRKNLAGCKSSKNNWQRCNNVPKFSKSVFSVFWTNISKWHIREGGRGVGKNLPKKCCFLYEWSLFQKFNRYLLIDSLKNANDSSFFLDQRTQSLLQIHRSPRWKLWHLTWDG